MKFLKFEFLNEAEWLVVRDSLYEDDVLIPEVTAIYEIGHICFESNEEGECIDLGTKYAVDMLCEEIEWLAPFMVWPAPAGIHIFAGWEETYEQEYYTLFPKANVV